MQTLLASHVRRMRGMASLAVALAVTVAVAGFAAPRLEPGMATPGFLSIIAYLAGLWIAFTAERDAGGRLATIRRAFAHHREVATLLADHRRVYATVLLRLLMMVVCGAVVAVWGTGPVAALPLPGLAVVLTALTWPTAAKSRLLVERAQREADPRG